MTSRSVGVEVGAYVTAVVDVGFWGIGRELVNPAVIEGDDGALRAVATLGRLMDFGGELLTHAQVFHRRQFG